MRRGKRYVLALALTFVFLGCAHVRPDAQAIDACWDEYGENLSVENLRKFCQGEK